MSFPGVQALGFIVLVGNAKLASIDFKRLTAVRRHLQLQGFIGTDMTGFGSLVSVGRLSLSENPGLKSLAGLDRLEEVGDLWIDGNSALASLQGLGGLRVVWTYATISWNDPLTSLAGLEGLEFIGSSLAIKSNASLTSVDGLENLRSIHGDYLGYASSALRIAWNSKLVSLHGLRNLTTVGGLIDVRDNAVPWCQIRALKFRCGKAEEPGPCP